MKSVNYYWRLFATGLSFSLFGMGGLILRIFVFPILSLIYFSKSDSRAAARPAQYIVHKAFYIFIEFMRIFGVLSYETHGLNKLNRKSQLVIANHPSLIDVVFLIAFIEQINCIVKSSLANNIFTRGPVRASGYITNNKAQSMVQECVSLLNAGESLIVFPEGTRTVPGQALKFQRGVSNIALRANQTVTPVIITCNPTTLTKAEKWYQIPLIKPHFSIFVLDDLAITAFTERAITPISVRHFNDYLKQFFAEELQRHDQFRART